MLVWVIYDITSDKARTRVAKYCKDYGLYRVQKSVFLGDLDKNSIDEVFLRSQDLIEATDSVYIFPMCDDDFRMVKIVGVPFDAELVTNQIRTKCI